MVREWAHNPTLNGSIPNSSLIKKLLLTKSIFTKTSTSLKIKKTNKLSLKTNLIVRDYNLAMSGYYFSQSLFSPSILLTMRLPMYLYLSILSKSMSKHTQT